MKKRDYRDHIQDIIDSIDDLESFTENMSFEDFSKDRKTINAVIRSVEVIGEATKKIPRSIRNKHPSIPWKKMAGIRDKMLLEYFPRLQFEPPPDQNWNVYPPILLNDGFKAHSLEGANQLTFPYLFPSFRIFSYLSPSFCIFLYLSASFPIYSHLIPS